MKYNSTIHWIPIDIVKFNDDDQSRSSREIVLGRLQKCVCSRLCQMCAVVDVELGHHLANFTISFQLLCIYVSRWLFLIGRFRIPPKSLRHRHHHKGRKILLEFRTDGGVALRPRPSKENDKHISHSQTREPENAPKFVRLCWERWSLPSKSSRLQTPT